MPTVAANDIEICYESYGPGDAPTVLLVMGLGAQLTFWPTGFVSELLDRGFRVVRFDNRECGLSTKSDGPPPDVLALMVEHAAGRPVVAPYSLSLLAADAVGLLDTLGIDAAHVVGASLGGMIAQMVAIEHPGRVLSLTSIMSTTGDPTVGEADPDALSSLLTPAPADRAEAIEQSVNTSRVISGELFDEARSRAMATESYDRGFHPTGPAFQLAAIGATGDRTERLQALDVPTLVIHGRQDSLIGLSGGEATAAAIPGADLLVLGRMGHDLPELYWAQIADAIYDVAARVTPGV
jgi:pimeloyl-ACP methyl ester carboxylesterase